MTLSTALLSLTLLGKIDRVLDGDTLHGVFTVWTDPEQTVQRNIRLRGINAPELHAAKCPAERAKAEAVRQLLVGLVEGKTVYLQEVGPYKYGGASMGRVLLEDGRDVSQVLLQQGVVRPYDGKSARLPWCP